MAIEYRITNAQGTVAIFPYNVQAETDARETAKRLSKKYPLFTFWVREVTTAQGAIATYNNGKDSQHVRPRG